MDETNRTNINFALATSELLIQWLAKIPFLEKETKRLLFEIGCIYKSNMPCMYQIYHAVGTNQNWSDEERKIRCKLQNNQYTLMYNGANLIFTKPQFQGILAGMIDILEDILPLGSVVDLKKEFFKDMLTDIDKIEQIRVVITNRFLYQEGDTFYFTYAGVVYPIGIFRSKQMLHFTSAVIENVVHTGYSDKQEEAYVFFMKQELIFEKGMHSLGFSTEEERERYLQRQKVPE